MARVQVENVTKIYAKDVPPAVSSVSIGIRHGELLVLLGPSGCGKSTLLRMVAGLEDITSGAIKIDDRVVNDVPSKDRDIAMVFQSYALYPHMTVRENMGFGLKLRRTPKAEIERRVHDAARILGLEMLLERRPRELSGGQMQRVAVGRAIVREPKVFLFDEPLSNLDAKLRGEMRVELKRLHQRLGATMIYVTHDQVEAMTLGDRVAVLSDGKLQQLGTPLEVYREPTNRFVAGFLGNPPMSFLPGRLEGATFVSDLGWRLALPERLAAGSDGRAVELGVRPEDFAVERGKPGDDALHGKITVTEILGSDTILYVNVAGADDTAADAFRSIAVQTRADADHREGEIVTLRPSAERVHLFDADTGVSLGAAAEAGASA